MEKERIINAIKNAILFEMHSRTIYQKTGESSKIKALRDMFLYLASEETKHMDILYNQLKRMHQGQTVDLTDLDRKTDSISNHILLKEIIDNLETASYEAAIISAALELEKKAVNYYSQLESEATDMAEKELFKWLSNWEKEHMAVLISIDKEIKEKIWYDNKFWPLD